MVGERAISEERAISARVFGVRNGILKGDGVISVHRMDIEGPRYIISLPLPGCGIDYARHLYGLLYGPLEA